MMFGVCGLLVGVVWCMLYGIRCLLFVVCVRDVRPCLLLVVRSMLCLGRCALWVVSRLLLVDCCLLFAVC